MSTTEKLSKEEFINKYPSGSIVFPALFARYFNLTTKAAYQYLRSNAGVREFCALNCPYCKRDLPTRYYTINSIFADETTQEVKHKGSIEKICPYCDRKFNIDIDNNAFVYYEKI